MVFIRHGETDMAGRFCGHSDPELNRSGETQISPTPRKKSQRSESSAFIRATWFVRRVLQPPSAGASAVGVELQPALREMNFGLWEGLKLAGD